MSNFARFNNSAGPYVPTNLGMFDAWQPGAWYTPPSVIAYAFAYNLPGYFSNSLDPTYFHDLHISTSFSGESGFESNSTVGVHNLTINYYAGRIGFTGIGNLDSTFSSSTLHNYSGANHYVAVLHDNQHLISKWKASSLESMSLSYPNKNLSLGNISVSSTDFSYVSNGSGVGTNGQRMNYYIQGLILPVNFTTLTISNTNQAHHTIFGINVFFVGVTTISILNCTDLTLFPPVIDPVTLSLYPYQNSLQSVKYTRIINTKGSSIVGAANSVRYIYAYIAVKIGAWRTIMTPYPYHEYANAYIDASNILTISVT